MEEYKGFFIDEDLSDHSVTAISHEWKVNYVTGNRRQAKAYIDGFIELLKMSIISSMDKNEKELVTFREELKTILSYSEIKI